MSDKNRTLTYEHIKRAAEMLQDLLEPEYIFHWRGRVYTGPSYGKCVIAAILDDPDLRDWWLVR